MTRARIRCVVAFVALALPTFGSACLGVQNFEGAEVSDGGTSSTDAPEASDVSDPTTNSPEGTLPSVAETSDSPGPSRWAWVNPRPTGRTLYAIGGTAEDDVWVAGEGGVIGHWNGSTWDVEYVSPGRERFFSIGTRQRNDVWVAGEASDRVRVLHYDGATWTEYFPFSGGEFAGFSHGPGKRLFAMIGAQALSLEDDGTWSPTNTVDLGFHGNFIDMAVKASGEAWGITTGGRTFRLRSNARKWENLPIGADLPPPSNRFGLGISVTGEKVCAFSASRTDGSLQFALYDGTWREISSGYHSGYLPDVVGRHGASTACFSDGGGVILTDYRTTRVRSDGTMGDAMPLESTYESPRAVWSVNGERALLVGAYGATAAYDIKGTFVGMTPSVRDDLRSIDVGLDGTVVVTSVQKTQARTGEIFVYERGAFGSRSGEVLLPPRLPRDVAVVSKDEVWVLTEEGSRVGLSLLRFGRWGVISFLHTDASRGEPLAIHAIAKNDIWITGRDGCSDLYVDPLRPCSKPQRGYVWHYDGRAITRMPTSGSYRAIHSRNPNDVWFAGDDGVLHWDGKELRPVPELAGKYAGVWAGASGRVWLWGERAVLFDGKDIVTVERALGSAAGWQVKGIAEAQGGEVFVLVQRAKGTSLLWFDASRTRLIEEVQSDLELVKIRGRGRDLWAIGAAGAALRFTSAAREK